MRTILYVAFGISVFTIGGLIIGLPIGYPLLIVIGSIIGLIVAEIRTRHKKSASAPKRIELCEDCYVGVHLAGMPCPNDGCHCARCSPFIGRYSPEDSPSFFQE